MIIAGILAGTGVYSMAEYIIQRLVDDPLIQAVWVLTPKGKYGHPKFFEQPKIFHINSWIGEDSHNKTGINREQIRLAIVNALKISDRITGVFKDVEWVWLGDEDAFPALDYFEKLQKLEYDYPVLLTGKTFNADRTRFYDICSFQIDAEPFCVPYDDWENPRWAKDLYCSGNQHVMNLAGFDLNVGYIDRPGEDPHYCWAFKKEGGRLVFRPELEMTLLKQHQHANMGSESKLPKATQALYLSNNGQ